MKTTLNTWLLAATGALAIAGLPFAAQSEDTVDKDPEQAKYLGEGARNAKACVADTDLMRRDHMLFLLDQRDKTMHQGIRTEKFSLVNCIDCHAKKDDQGEWISQNSPEHFCQGCHAYSGIKIDCFECHAGKP